MVLRVLERVLHDVSIEAVREGQQIRTRGLGPSQRTMNRNDLAVVEVARENDYTVIRADITYLSSALLGGVPQDDLVRSKLDRVLDRVEMELGTKRVRNGALPWIAEPIREPEHEFEPEYRGEPEQTIDHEHVGGRSVEVEHHFVAEARGESEEYVGAELVDSMAPAAAVETVYAEEAVVAPEPVHVVEPATEAEAVHELVTVPESKVVAPVNASVALPAATKTVSAEIAIEKPITGAVPERKEERLEVPMFQTFQPEESKTPRRWGLLATVACMLAAVGLFLAWPYLMGLVHERLNPTPSVAEGSVAGDAPEATKLAADKTPMEVPDANTAAIQNAAIHSEGDPRIWLESWAKAMQGQDAGVQAAFYADPVEHYALKSNVSNADVWLDKKNAIQGRPKLWTMKLEDVTLEPRPEDSMRVRLTKHIVSQTDSGRVSEQFIHSQLKLKKIDGQWKITSEQNLRP